MYCWIEDTSHSLLVQMLTVIKTKIGSEDACYLTRLDTDQMGTYEDIKQRVNMANSQHGGFMSRIPKEMEFSGTNITVDAATVSPRAATLCNDLPVVWMQAVEPSFNTGKKCRLKPDSSIQIMYRHSLIIPTPLLKKRTNEQSRTVYL